MVNTTAAAEISWPSAVRTPATRPSFKIRSSAAPSRISRLAIWEQRVLHGGAIKRPVGLGAGPAHGRAFAAVEQAELNPGPVRDPAHQAVQGIDLPHQMAFADTADGGIAGHFTQGLALVGEEQSAGTRARRSRRRFAAGMAAANHDDIMAAHAR